MNVSKPTYAMLSAAATLTLSANLSSCKGGGEEQAARAIQPVNVRIETVRPELLEDVFRVAGTLKAAEEANISPEEGGAVKKWVVSKGHRVSKGEIIVLLKDEVIKASYDAALAQYRMAELNLEKQQKVFDEKGISELQYKNLAYGRDAAKANADLMQARWERTQLRSPIDGILDNTVPNEGEFAPPGMPIARVVNTSAFKVQAEIPEVAIGSIRLHSSVNISFDAFPQDTLRGTVSFLGASVASANRTVLAEIMIRASGRNLRPEMVAKVAFVRERKLNAVLVSENLVQLADRDRSIVYVERDGKAEERVLTIGGRQGTKVEVLSGLNVGDRLVVSGFQKLVHGTPVTITDESEKRP
jgi:RND family efflux transporter MFP subunit